MFDVSDLEMARAVTEVAEELRAPVILGALAPDLEGGRLDYWAALAKLAAEKSATPVCIHLDHANTLEQVRAVLADKSRAGYTAAVRALLEKHGAAKLSQVDPKNYEALLKDAEVLGNAT